jgi:hypothetical protein
MTSSEFYVLLKVEKIWVIRVLLDHLVWRQPRSGTMWSGAFVLLAQRLELLALHPRVKGTVDVHVFIAKAAVE